MSPTGDDEADLLFHYTTFNALYSILKTGLWRASDVHFLNDSAEQTLVWKAARSILDGWLRSADVGKRAYAAQLLPDILDELSAGAFDRIYVVSLSAKGDQLSQWRAYCGLGGVAIGVDREALRATLPHPWVLETCLYFSEHDLLATIEAMMLKNSQEYEGRMPDTTVVRRWLWDNAPIAKHDSFAEEAESRIIWRRADLRPTSPPCGPIKFHPTHHYLKPYLELTLPLDLVRKVRVGPHGEPELAQASLYALKRGIDALAPMRIVSSSGTWRGHGS